MQSTYSIYDKKLPKFKKWNTVSNPVDENVLYSEMMHRIPRISYQKLAFQDQ